jgi:hypothetical protein
MPLSKKTAIFAVLSLGLGLLSASCKTTRDTTPASSDTPGSPLVVSLGEKTQLLSAGSRGAQARHSPLGSINIQIFERWISAGFDIVDIDQKTSEVVSITGHVPSSVPRCFAIAIVNEVSITGRTSSFLVTRYQNTAATGLPVLTYCQPGGFSAAQQEDIEQFRRYWSGEDAIDEPSFGLVPGSIKIDVGSHHLPEPNTLELPKTPEVMPRLSTDELSERKQTSPQQGETSSSEEISSREPTPSPSEEVLRAQKEKASTESIFKLGSNAAVNSDIDTWANLKKTNEVTIHEELGKGTFATVSRVSIGNQNFAMRVERKPDNIGIAIWTGEKLRERNSNLVVSQIARANPTIRFVEPLLSYVSYGKKEFVTLMPLIQSDLRKSMKSMTDEQKAQFFGELKEQINAFHRGVPIKIGEDTWTLSIFHRDLKPENIGVDENFRPRVFDFGFSEPIVWRSVNGKREIMHFGMDGNGKFRSDDFGPKQAGTPYYFTPESLKFSQNGGSAEVLMKVYHDVDIHGVNAIAYEMKYGEKFMTHLAAQGKIELKSMDALEKLLDLKPDRFDPQSPWERLSTLGERTSPEWRDISLRSVKTAELTK